jgi:hypothetical protein
MRREASVRDNDGFPQTSLRLFFPRNRFYRCNGWDPSLICISIDLSSSHIRGGRRILCSVRGPVVVGVSVATAGAGF